MDGVDKMSKAELTLLCEKHKVDGGKTVGQMRYALKKFLEDEESRAPSSKKHKAELLSLKPTITKATTTTIITATSSSDSSSGAAGSGACPLGESCPQLHSYSHRCKLKHGAEYRDVPFICRDGLSCSKLHDKEHAKKYAHEDSLDKVCKLGAECPELHLLEHRRQYEHPGFRAQPFPCRDGMGCAMLKDRAHLYKYAHASGPAPPGPTTRAAVPPAETSIPHALAKTSSEATTPTAVPATSARDTGTVPPAPSFLLSIEGKTFADFPLELCTDAILTPIPTDGAEFWDLEEKFNANLQGRNDDYVLKRIQEGKKPIRFVLVGAERISNSILQARFEVKKREMLASRDSKDCRERVSFHGTHPKNLTSILRTGLLRFKHPLNPCKSQVDDGYFGSNKKGIYVSRYADYTLKYSNRVCPVEPRDEVKTIMFKTLPGRSLHIAKLSGPIDPTDGYDSHSSPSNLEWYLFDEAQACPQYVLSVRAVEDTRTAADDE